MVDDEIKDYELDEDALESESGYRVKLDMFEGPLDLLLHLIKRAKIRICDIFISDITRQFLEFIGDGVLVAHNAGFDVGFIEQNCRNLGLNDHFVYLDTVALARVLLPTLSKYKLNVVAKALNISLENHHRAVDDAGATAEIFVKFVEMLKKDSITTLKEVNHYGDRNVNAIRKMPTHHIIILAKNDIGRYNLYQLITESHLTYYARRPRIPKTPRIPKRHRRLPRRLLLSNADKKIFSTIRVINKKLVLFDPESDWAEEIRTLRPHRPL